MVRQKLGGAAEDAPVCLILGDWKCSSNRKEDDHLLSANQTLQTQPALVPNAEACPSLPPFCQFGQEAEQIPSHNILQDCGLLDQLRRETDMVGGTTVRQKLLGCRVELRRTAKVVSATNLQEGLSETKRGEVHGATSHFALSLQASRREDAMPWYQGRKSPIYWPLQVYRLDHQTLISQVAENELRRSSETAIANLILLHIKSWHFPHILQYLPKQFLWKSFLLRFADRQKSTLPKSKTTQIQFWPKTVSNADRHFPRKIYPTLTIFQSN